MGWEQGKDDEQAGMDFGKTRCQKRRFFLTQVSLGCCRQMMEHKGGMGGEQAQGLFGEGWMCQRLEDSMAWGTRSHAGSGRGKKGAS